MCKSLLGLHKTRLGVAVGYYLNCFWLAVSLWWGLNWPVGSIDYWFGTVPINNSLNYFGLAVDPR